MNHAHVTVMKRSVYLWAGAAFVMAVSIYAAYQPTEATIYAALVVSGLYAFVGIGFGIWAGRTLTRDASHPQ